MKKANMQAGFDLQNIKVEQFAVFEEYYSQKKETGIGIELQLKIDQKNKQIGVFLSFEFIQAKRVFLKIVVSCHFKIEESSWNGFIQAQGVKLVIPKALLSHLATITMGTSRGILFAKTEGTQFSKFFIPAIDISEMIDEDASFDVASE